MKDTLQQSVESIIAEQTGQAAKISRQSMAGGGCINNAAMIELDDGRRFFIKSNPNPLPHLFQREVEMLEALVKADAIRVPKPLGASGEDDGAMPFIVMEYIESGPQKPDFFETFGRQFALLHRKTKSERYGFEHDNYIGATPQPNGWKDDWVEFWREHRLGFQLDLARRNGYSDSAMERLGNQVMERLEELIGEPDEPACLLHGDLWGGNYLSDENGEPVLIDPAAYYGRREADIAMTLVFGGFNSRFYSAYEEVWPLAPGSQERLDMYKLYHLLNHLNVFGTSYYGSCISILQRYAR